MGSTHYMDLLMQNSPWNLLVFMAIPVILAESIAISELYILWKGEGCKRLELFNRICGILAGITFTAIIIYFIPNILAPLMENNGWRTWVDEIAIFSYILSGIPMILIALLDTGLICPKTQQKNRRFYKILFLSVFLILSHVAMIFGMVDPTVVGWKAENEQMGIHNHQITPSHEEHMHMGHSH